MNKSINNKRLDIEGLRALAVISVLLFHLQLFGINGGFIGVDIFFVISGYVIFRNITKSWISGEFSFISFFSKRLFRLYPALLITIILTLVAGYFLLTTKEYQDLSVSSLMALISASNIYYADQFDYFAGSAITKPLLHSWSLGVEMQFYIIFTLALILVPKNKRNKNSLLLMLSIFFISSLSANFFLCFIENDYTKAFYMPFSRFWQMALGAIVATIEKEPSNHKRESGLYKIFIKNFISFCAISSLTASFWLIDENMKFPGLIVLIPTLLTAILLLIKDHNNFNMVSSILKLPPFVFIGKISYSIYLMHWAFISLLYLYMGRHLEFYEKILFIPFVIILSYFTWKFVENPARKLGFDLSKRKNLVYLYIPTFTVIIFSLFIITLKGIGWRYSIQTKQTVDKIEKTLSPNNDKCVKKAINYKIDKTNIHSCQLENIEDANYILWGDSHAGMISSSLQLELSKNNIFGFSISMAACNPIIGSNLKNAKNQIECEKLKNFIKDFINKHKIPTIILASRWGQISSKIRSPGDGSLPLQLYRGNKKVEFKDAILQTVKYFKDLGINVVLVSSVPEVSFDVPSMMTRSQMLSKELPPSLFKEFTKRQHHTIEAFKRVEDIYNISVIYPHKKLCDENKCMIIKQGRPLYKDDDHLTILGANEITYDIAIKVNQLTN